MQSRPSVLDLRMENGSSDVILIKASSRIVIAGWSSARVCVSSSERCTISRYLAEARLRTDESGLSRSRARRAKASRKI